MPGPVDPLKRGWRSIRFTLGELFLLLAGLALGLAYARVDGSDRWHDFLLAIFGGCFVVGLVQKSWRTRSLRRGDPTISFIDATWPLAVAVLMVFCAVMQAAARHKWWAFQNVESSSSSWEVGDLIGTAFFLAVICGYSIRKQAVQRQGWRRWATWIVDAAVWLLAAFWLFLVLEDGMVITTLVHIAIRGVEATQPTRLAGRPFYPANLHNELMQQVVVRAYLTGVLLTTATIANIALGRLWSKGFAHRMLWAAACCACLLPAAWLVWWSMVVAFPQLSPFYYPLLGKLPPGNSAVVLVIVVAATGAFAAGVCAVSRPTPRAPGTQAVAVPLHEWIFVPALFLLGELWNGFEASRVDGWGYMLQMVLSQPRWMLWIASLILIVQRMWRWLRPSGRAAHTEWTVPVAPFVAVWNLALLTGLLLIPAASWFGFALCMRWRGP